jgi:hypothetical protein
MKKFYILQYLLLVTFTNIIAQTHVQTNTKYQSSAATSITCTFASTSVNGDLIVVHLDWSGTTQTVSAVTDNKGNVYKKINGTTVWNANTSSAELWYAYNITGGAIITATATLSAAPTGGSPYSQIYISEYSGISYAVDPLDQNTVATGTATSVNSGSKITTHVNELIYGACIGGGAGTIGVGAGFTSRSTANNNIIEDVAATGTYSANFSSSVSAQWVAQMATFVGAQYIVDEGFIAGPGTNNSGFTLSLSGTYTGGNDFGRNSPSVKFANNGDYIEYGPWVGEADHISFLHKAETSASPGTYAVQESANGTVWATVTGSPVTPITTAATFDASLLSTSRYIKITYTKTADNAMLDDLRIRSINAFPSTAKPFTLLLEMINGQCGTCEGYDEFIAFITGDSALYVPYFELVNPTMTYGAGDLAMGGNGISSVGAGGNNNTNINWLLNANLTATQTNYTASLNTTAGSIIFYNIPANNTIPPNSEVIAFTGSAPNATYNFSALAGKHIYVIYADDASGCTGTGKYGNTCATNCTRYMTIFNHRDGEIANASFTTPASTVAGDGWNFVSSAKVSSGCNSFGSPLPIDLLSFSANCVANGTVNINWSTASETNNDYFTIEKSTDLENWDVVSTVKGAGNSNSVLNYSITDDIIPGRNYYYRLKQTDFNGNSKTFDPMETSCNETQADYLHLNPNPAKDNVTCIIASSGTSIVTLEILNYTGQKMHFEKLSLVNGYNNINVNLTSFSNGGYKVIVRSADGVMLANKPLIIVK